jgi:hypothetical protein
MKRTIYELKLITLLTSMKLGTAQQLSNKFSHTELKKCPVVSLLILGNRQNDRHEFHTRRSLFLLKNVCK